MEIKGQVIMWSGAMGLAADAHFPVNPDTGLVDHQWHLCNGDTQNGVVTPNLASRFVIATGAGYAKGQIGGAMTKNLAHTHGVGTLVNVSAQAGAHTHSVAAASPPFTGLQDAASPIRELGWEHDHGGVTGNTNPPAHTHGHSGSTASGGSASQDIVPAYYALVYLCYVGGAA